MYEWLSSLELCVFLSLSLFFPTYGLFASLSLFFLLLFKNKCNPNICKSEKKKRETEKKK